ncbi:hypothetical protein O181_039692 [Austropuccinia psidii MF-1]|uniref:Uncharacterized protein n=1 Tax=Austropuccinia psidii MF-1 TaxID=1389203 RepID=A0A9Q3HD56_9BASI|nr:hypothetical protein [Austropuccinia psidii MF-1]
MVTSTKLQPVASSSQRREDHSPLPFPAIKVFQKRNVGPSMLPEIIQIWRAKAKMLSQSFLIRVDRNGREVIMYANDRMIPGTASEDLVAKFSCYEDRFINDFQRSFYDLGRDI